MNESFILIFIHNVFWILRPFLFEYIISSMYYITSSSFSFGLTPAEQLNVPSVVANQSVDVSLPLATTGQVQRMDPLTNLQVTKKIKRAHEFLITLIIKSRNICRSII